MTTIDRIPQDTQTPSAPLNPPVDGPATTANPLTELGPRLRAARHARGWSQDRVAKPEFTKSYVSAVERGKARPSLKALELMSRRLGVSSSDLLNMVTLPDGVRPDPVTQQAEIAYQLDQVQHRLDTAQPREALRLLDMLEGGSVPGLDQAAADSVFRLAYLRALAQLQVGDPGAAHQALAVALLQATVLPNGEESVERVHTRIGEAYAQQNLPALARDEYERGLAAIERGVVHDPSLRLAIYHRLANTYWVLGEIESALDIYRATHALRAELPTLERQAALYWDVSTAYRNAGNPTDAQRAASRALGMAEGAQNLTVLAQLHIQFAQILSERQEYSAAEAALAQAQALLANSGNHNGRSLLHQQYALLELQRGQVADAVAHAAAALAFGGLGTAPPSSADTTAESAETLAVQLGALRTAGCVAEAQGDPTQADRLFQQALQLAAARTAGELAAELARSYAEVLAARGRHEEANHYYRQAVEQRRPPRNR